MRHKGKNLRSIFYATWNAKMKMIIWLICSVLFTWTTFAPFLVLDAAPHSSLDPRGLNPLHPSRSIQTLPLVLLWAKGKIKTNRTLIRGSRFSLLSCWRKEPSPGRLPQIKASCLPLAALPMRIATTKPAETIIYSFWCGFWSYPTSSTMHPSSPSYPYPSLHHPTPPAFCIFYSQGNKVMPASP